MAHKNPIAIWLYTNREKYDVQFTMMNWTKRYDVPLYDFEVSCNYKSFKILGRGVDENKEIALEKASSELIEKMICIENEFDSVGLAASVAVDATLHAQNEALERYYLKCHLDQKIGFELMKIEVATAFQNLFNRISCDVQFYKMHTAPSENGVICFLNHRENFDLFSFGFSYGQDSRACAHKSLIEALPNIIWKIENPTAETDIWQISPEFKNKIKPLFALPVSDQTIIASPQLNAVEIKNCHQLVGSLSELKFFKCEAVGQI